MFESHFGAFVLCKNSVGLGGSRALLGQVISMISDYQKQFGHEHDSPASYTE